jgi:hypothetical protein
LLRSYNPATRSWNLPRTGEFWDAVKSAHELGRFGDGQTIAVVDDGFDLSIPALAEQTLIGNINDTAPSAHGTVVALLLLAVAPKARLMLYPTAVRGRLDPAAVGRALNDVNTNRAMIVSISLGAPFPLQSVLAVDEYLRSRTPWPQMSEYDVPFWIGQGLGELDGWRDLVRPPQSIFEAPIAALERSGHTVIAATGNAQGHIYDPALRAGVFSVAFISVKRSIDSFMEEAFAKAPTFSQSEVFDFSIMQPPNVLGSSFATPQLTGFAALMASRGDLGTYAEVLRLASLAESLMVKLEHDRHAWSDKHDGVIDQLFLKAIHASPHLHFVQCERKPCPECALFTASAFINYGLFKLNWGDLDGAEALLGPAESFAPANPHAAANLGIVYARRAMQAQMIGNYEEVSQHLKTATCLLQKASRLRPEHEPYQQRVGEFMFGADHPNDWQMAL